MRIALGIALISVAAASPAAASMTKEEHRAGILRVDAEYQADRQKCGARLGNAADLCIARARSAQRVAKAELQAAYKPGPRAYYNAAMARAQAQYAVANEECDDRKGDARTTCIAQAKSVRERARAQARHQLKATPATKSP